MKIKLLASAIVAGTMFSSIAMADVVSGGSGTIGQAQTSWESNGATGGSSTAAIPNVETAINFSAFDSALGTLTSVTFDYSYNVLGDLTITNTGTSSLTYTDVSVKPLIQYDLFNDATTAGDVEAFHNDSIVLFTSAFGTTLANNGDFDTYVANETNSGSLTVSTNLDSFLTAFDFGCSADVGNASSISSGSGQVTFDGTAACTVDVTYTYTAAEPTPTPTAPPAVPVPATALLFGLGLLGFSTRLKSKKA